MSSPLEQYLADLANFEGLNVPDSLYDDLMGFSAGADSKIAELGTELESVRAALQSVQAHNYELLQSAASEPGAENNDDESDSAESDESPESAIDDLFEDKD